jgi:hypothetical protein
VGRLEQTEHRCKTDFFESARRTAFANKSTSAAATSLELEDGRTGQDVHSALEQTGLQTLLDYSNFFLKEEKEEEEEEEFEPN